MKAYHVCIVRKNSFLCSYFIYKLSTNLTNFSQIGPNQVSTKEKTGSIVVYDGLPCLYTKKNSLFSAHISFTSSRQIWPTSVKLDQLRSVQKKKMGSIDVYEGLACLRSNKISPFSSHLYLEALVKFDQLLANMTNWGQYKRKKNGFYSCIWRPSMST